MCFVFILTKNKWYIFFKKWIKCDTERFPGRRKEQKVREKQRKKTEQQIPSRKHWKMNNKQTMRSTKLPRSLPQPLILARWPCEIKLIAYSDESTERTPWKEYFLIQHQFKPTSVSNLIFFFLWFFFSYRCYIDTRLFKLAYLCFGCCHREHTHMGHYVRLHWLGTVCSFFVVVFSFHYLVAVLTVYADFRLS